MVMLDKKGERMIAVLLSGKERERERERADESSLS